MRVAFYAPMKPPDHPVPSGDRQVAQLLVRALKDGGHQVELASRMRSWQAKPDEERQRRLDKLGERLAQRLLKKYRERHPADRPAVWLTYHLYYKAPDFIGPRVAKALGIPYLVAEASLAEKRAGGPWDHGHKAAKQAMSEARFILNINPEDAEALPASWRQKRLPPFLDTTAYEAASKARARHRRGWVERSEADDKQPWLVALAMMREGDKLASYKLLAQALRGLPDLPWQLLIAGDGPARSQVETAFQAFATGRKKRVHFLGELRPEAVPGLLAAADLVVWPAIGEAYGMALLEAQAAATPVVAGKLPGVAAIVEEGRSGILTKAGDAATFAAAIRAVLSAPALRRQMSQAAQVLIAERHSLKAASQRLTEIMEEAVRS
jgi:glycosyltransferase involved in cell wall biosynthesis